MAYTAYNCNFSRIIAGVMKWGIWGENLSSAQLEALICGSIESGVTTFDHADIYGHYTEEARFGNVLGTQPALRQKMQLISKCGICLVTPNRPQHRIKSYNTSQAHLIESVENSLRALQTDYLDALLLHRPSPLMQPEEIAAAFTALKAAGKVLHFGVSNFTPSQVTLLDSCFPVEINQIEASVLRLEPFSDGVLDQCIVKKIRPMAWSPLGGGALVSEKSDERIERIRAKTAEIATRYNATADQILFAFLLKHPSQMDVVLGTSKIERVQSAVAAQNIPLSNEEWFELWSASAGRDVP
jgi:predicted oxidoreductase